MMRAGTSSRHLLPLMVLLVIWSVPAEARISVAPRATTLAVTWTGGDLVQVIDLCVESLEEPSPNTFILFPYRAGTSIAGSTAYELKQPGQPPIPAAVTLTDLVTGVDYTPLYGDFTPTTLSGTYRNCPNGNNFRATIFVSAADLGDSLPGTYSASFRIDLQNDGSGKKQDFSTVDLSVSIPAIIRVGNVDDIVLGVFDGVNDQSGIDTLCVYRNGGTLYSVVLTGSGAGGAFTLANGAVTVPYAVTWDDGGGAVTVTPGTTLLNRNNAFNANSSCNAGAADSAKLGVSVLASDLLSAMIPGQYAGTITILVAPQ